MKIETAIKKVVAFLESNPGATKTEITAKTKIAGIELTNVIKALRKEGRLIEEKGEDKSLKFSISAEAEVTTEPATELEIPVEDEQTAPASKGRNNDKYKFNGQEYGKGPLVRAVVAQYVTDNPKTTYKQLKEIFPDSLMRRFGIFEQVEGKKDEPTASSISGARPRYFMKDEQFVRLAGGKLIAVCSQFTYDNIQPFLKTARALGFKIK